MPRLKSTKKLAIIISCLLFFSITVNAKYLKDTTYLFFFSYHNNVLQLNLEQKDSHFELKITGNKFLVGKQTPAEGKPDESKIVITGFDSNITTSPTRNLPLDFNLDLFQKTLIQLLQSHSIETGVTDMELISFYKADQQIISEINSIYQKAKESTLKRVQNAQNQQVAEAKNDEIKKINAGHTKSIDSLVNLLEEVDEEHRYGGQIELADTTLGHVRIYNASQEDDEKGNPRYVAIDTNDIKFKPSSIVVRTFNNFVDQIHVYGTVIMNGVSTPVNFYNGDFSSSLKSLFERKHYIAFRIPYKVESNNKNKPSDTAKASTGNPSAFNQTDTSKTFVRNTIKQVDFHTYLINISDLIRINTYKNQLTFMIKNDSYRLDSLNKKVPYQRRTFYDYLSFTTFLDFLGVIEKTPNSLIQIEGRIRLPLRLITSRFLSNKKYIYNNVFFPKLDAYLNASFINGSQADSRFGTIYAKSPNTLDTLYIDNFDLIRKNNIRTGLELGLIKRERKQSNTNFYLDYGAHFVRTNLLYTIINPSALDETREFNAWSWTHGPIFRMEYRPDQNIGMDFSVAYNFNQKLLNSDNDNLRVFEVKGPLNSNRTQSTGALEMITNRARNNVKMEFNAYFMLNPTRSNGGLYFRLSNYFSDDFHQIFPQVLIGYSTRLSGMIKNFRNRQGE